MRRRILPACLSLSVLLGAACGDDNPAASSPELSRAEISSLMQAVVSGATSGFASPGAAGLELADADEFTIPLNEVQPCASGDVALLGKLVGRYDEAGATLRTDLDATATHRQCAVPTGAGKSIRITGDPSTGLRVGMTIAGRRITRLDVSVAGAFAWDRGRGPTRRCALNVSGALDAAGNMLAITGTFCGETLNERVSLGGA